MAGAVVVVCGAGAARVAGGVGSAASQSVAEGCPRLGSTMLQRSRDVADRPRHASTVPNVLIARIAAALGLPCAIIIAASGFLGLVSYMPLA